MKCIIYIIFSNIIAIKTLSNFS